EVVGDATRRFPGADDQVRAERRRLELRGRLGRDRRNRVPTLLVRPLARVEDPDAAPERLPRALERIEGQLRVGPRDDDLRDVPASAPGLGVDGLVAEKDVVRAGTRREPGRRRRA